MTPTLIIITYHMKMLRKYSSIHRHNSLLTKSAIFDIEN